MTAIASNYLTPGPRDEDWRFTPLNRLAGLHDGSAVIGTQWFEMFLKIVGF